MSGSAVWVWVVGCAFKCANQASATTRTKDCEALDLRVRSQEGMARDGMAHDDALCNQHRGIAL